MRSLILFDIDGTLVRGGPAKQAFRTALEAVFGTAGRADEWEFSGKTDPQIATELLADAGLSHDRIQAGLELLWDAYVDEMTRRIEADPPVVLPGVEDLVERLGAMEDMALGLVTGNIARGARLKLGAVGLEAPFAIGAFGSDHPERNNLPRVAIGRAERHWGVRFRPDEVVVLGDTPRDVACGRHAGARTVAVATGRFGMETLTATRPDRVFADLSDTGAVMEAILDGTPTGFRD